MLIRGIPNSAVLVFVILMAMLVGVRIASFIGPDKSGYAFRCLHGLQPFELLEAIEYNVNREDLKRTQSIENVNQRQTRPRSFDETTASSTRMTRRVSETLKKTIAHRQRYHCAMCQQMLPPSYQIDHIIPLYVDVYGTRTEYLNSAANLQALCPNCHSMKTQEDAMKYKN
jgi:5-methylcytosine-specific restriction endonuclease McrA